jgi:hypothetical protein
MATVLRKESHSHSLLSFFLRAPAPTLMRRGYLRIDPTRQTRIEPIRININQP